MSAKVFEITEKKFSKPGTESQAINALWHIDEVILNTTDTSALAKRVVNVMLEELGYLKLGYVIIVLSLLGKNKKILKRTSISQTTYAKKALIDSPVSFKDIEFRMDDISNLSVKSLIEDKAYVTDKLSDMLRPAIKPEIVDAVQEKLGIVTSITFPITSRGKPLGTLIFSLNKKEKEITKFERQILTGFSNAVGIAIEHAYLFKTLKEANKKLIGLDKQKDEFISVAAHELRAPMTAVKGYLSMIMEGDAGEVPPEISAFLKDTSDASERLIRLVNNMLNVSRIEEGRLVYEMGNVHLAEVAKTSHKEFQAQAKSKGLVLKLDVAKDINDLVYVDMDRIHEVVANLVSNAVKYTDKGTVTIRVSNSQESVVKLEVVDTGRGISESEQEKIFQKFGRAESSAGKTIGTGLGLYISKLLVEEFKGKLGYESIEDEGSNFWFALPVVTKTKK